ncbi:MAG TPA: DHA2 family efflux MFS transporter permease subunit [Nevskia sp.]|nr:DHA2 family efflux MFS transporter permease subunit [Nevskia sp.]
MYDGVAIGDRSLDEDAARAARRRAGLGFWAMALGSFMAILDIQIVASSINEIRAGLSASVDEIQWVQTSYLIAEVIAIPLSGYLARMLSTRIYFVLCAVGFTLSSLACAGAWSLGSMVVFRVLQGLLGGGMIPTAFATMFILFPDTRSRAVPQVLTGMLTMTASSLGPSIGGYVTDALSWHWLFLLNLVPGVICGWAVWNFVDIDRPQPRMFRQFDLWGLVFMAMFLGGLEYTLDDGPRHDWFSEDSVAVCAMMAAAGGALFFWRAFSAAHPLVDLRSFRNRNFAVTSLVSTVLGMGMFTLIYLTPVFLGQVRGYNPLQIGEVMMIQGGTMFLSAPLVGRLQMKFDPRLVIGLGLVLIGIGTWINGQVTADWGIAQFALPQALRGTGFVCSFIPLTGLALGTLPPSDVHNASGLFNVTRNLGGALGLAVITTLINQRTWLHWQQLAESTRLSREPVREALGSMQALLDPQLGAASQAGSFGMLAQQAQLQAATLTYGDMYRLLAVCVFGAILLLPLLEKPRGGAAPAGH